MRKILERFAEAEFHADWDEARARYGDDATPDLLARTARQRRFDALYNIFQQAASTPPGAQPPEPVVNIVADHAFLDAALSAAVRSQPPAAPPAPPADPARWRCDTLDGTVLDPLDVLAAALVGHVRRVVYDSASTVIDLGRASRLFTGLARHAAWLQGVRCMWPGCGHRHCQVDHTTEWHDQGTTNPANAGPLCGWHNRWKTRGYTVWRDPDGHWHTYRPDGTEITAA